VRYDRKRKNSSEKKTEVSFKGIKKKHKFTVFARVICALFFSILAAEKSGYVKYADFLLWRS